MKLVLVSCLLIFSFSAKASFESSKMTYTQLRNDLNAQLEAIEDQAATATEQTRIEIKNKLAEKEKCTSFACAKQIDDEVKSLNQILDETMTPFNQRIEIAKKTTTDNGVLLAVSTYADEATGFLQRDVGAIIFSTKQAQTCGLSYPAPGPGMICETVNYEFRLGGVFYQTDITFGIYVSYPDLMLLTLDRLFSGSKKDFLLGKDRQSEFALKRSFITPVDYNILREYYDEGDPQRKYIFASDKIGFRSYNVNQTP